ncbi:fructosamine kinase family protein [Salipiger abyssi]|uniref:Fructosamine-3-kinase n=1 Tax=Salipiger abyssi TaxID=1250539 RepID=A0A1P8UWQ4_9RHOB|nr:fructosamine kinase family protein [Salipiger abyssi]APZ53843.1 fructosamine-3-kinase [Salipiger abyssi]
MSLDGLAQVFGAGIASARPLHGGDLSEVLKVTLEDGRVMAVKRGERVDSEARMLAAMATAEAPVPEVLHQAGSLLCLQWLDEAPASAVGWQALGQGLRRLHNCRGAQYGWPEDYAFGPQPIPNGHAGDWPDFWARRRLLPFLPVLPMAQARRLEALARALPERLPARPTPALLHGDLWTGNALFGDGNAWMIDPACYHGHAEVDLAMLELFGNPTDAFWQGYGPQEPGRAERRPIYQLFPALVHFRLFGASYQGMVARLLSATGV